MPPISRAAPVPALFHLPGTGKTLHQRKSARTDARRLTLAPHPAAVPGVRRMSAEVAREWGLDGMSDTVALLVSELITNAVRASADGGPGSTAAGPGAEVVLTLSLSGTSMAIEVWDSRPDPAALLQPDADTESGRGLLIVEALASRWGQRAAAGGTVVWCEIALSPGAVPAAGGQAGDATGRATVPAASSPAGRPARRAAVAAAVLA